MKAFLLLFLPIFLHAGWFDWFQEPETPFECPFDCGKWGSDEIHAVEWKGILALYEVDKLSSALQGNSFPFSSPSTHQNDSWYQKLHSDGVTFQIPVYRAPIKGCHRAHWLKNHGCCCEKDVGDGSTLLWETYHLSEEEGLQKGLGFELYYNSTDSESYETYYDELGPLAFKSVANLQFFSQMLTEPIEHHFTVYNEEHADHLKSLFTISDQLRLNIEQENKTVTQLEKKVLECAPHETTIRSNREYFLEKSRRKIETIKKEVAEIVLEETRLSSEASKYNSLFALHVPLVESRLTEMLEEYGAIFDHCIDEHKSPSAYLERSRVHYALGDNIGCIEDIKKLFEIASSDAISDKVLAKLEQTKGTAECEIGLFDEAILTLSAYMKNHPHYSEDYLERAIAYFETGDFHSAIEDFAVSGFSANPIHASQADDLALAAGMIKGLTVGSAQALIEFVPSVLSSLYGLSSGLWAFATAPEEVSDAMCSAIKETALFVKEQGVEGTACKIFPELRELVEKGDQLSYMRQGELMGKIIGRYGIEFLLIGGTHKALRAYRTLRKANAALTFKQMSISSRAEHILLMQQKEWWAKTAPIIKEIKATKRFDQQLYKTFKNHNLSENQVRKILHHAGFKTFPRPKGVPRNWNVSLSERNGGMRYRLEVLGKGNRLTIEAEVRVMPGDPKAMWPAQRAPYVLHNSNGKLLDKAGNVVSSKSAEAHIPISEYDFRKLNQLCPYE